MIDSKSMVGIKFAKENLSNLEIFKKLDDFYDEQLKRFVQKHEKYGLKYEYKRINNNFEKMKEDIPDIKNMCSEEAVRKSLMDDGSTTEEIEEYLKEIYESPIEDFLITQNHQFNF